jgi:hypothetical protein
LFPVGQIFYSIWFPVVVGVIAAMEQSALNAYQLSFLFKWQKEWTLGTFQYPLATFQFILVSCWSDILLYLVPSGGGCDSSYSITFSTFLW